MHLHPKQAIKPQTTRMWDYTALGKSQVSHSTLATTLLLLTKIKAVSSLVMSFGAPQVFQAFATDGGHRTWIFCVQIQQHVGQVCPPDPGTLRPSHRTLW